MNGKKYLALVLHDESEWKWYGLHEALLEDNSSEPYWVGSKALRKFDNYNAAVNHWGQVEEMSGFVDILNYTDVVECMDKVDYSEEEQELNFDE